MNLDKDFMNFITDRQCLALMRASENPLVKEFYKRQDKSEKEVEKILARLKKHERDTVRRHYEQEFEMLDIEFNEVYIQGVQGRI